MTTEEAIAECQRGVQMSRKTELEKFAKDFCQEAEVAAPRLGKT